MAHRVFLSFSRKDGEVAGSIAEQLRRAGAEVLELQVHKEQSETQVADAMRQSDEIVVIVSSNSAQSPWLNYEIGLAVGLSKRLTPVLVGIDPKELSPTLRSLDALTSEQFRDYVVMLSDKIHGQRLSKHSPMATFEHVFRFAKSPQGMAKTRSGAEQFARLWMERFLDRNFDEFTKVYSFAKSLEGMAKARSEAEQFAMLWTERFPDRDFDEFTRVYSFAKSLEGMAKARSEAEHFARLWMEDLLNRDFDEFTRVYSFAKSLEGMSKTSSEAEQFAKLWTEKPTDRNFDEFRKIYLFARSPEGMGKTRSEAEQFAVSMLSTKRETARLKAGRWLFVTQGILD